MYKLPIRLKFYFFLYIPETSAVLYIQSRDKMYSNSDSFYFYLNSRRRTYMYLSAVLQFPFIVSRCF